MLLLYERIPTICRRGSMNTSDRERGVAGHTETARCFVLVHGAFYGAWLWDRLRPLLKAAGREVLTPTLTGLGERSDALSPDVGLGTHVDDVVRFLDEQAVDDAVLLAYSYAGMLVPGVSAKATGRLSQLVFLDAFVPDEGDRCFDLMPAEAQASIRRQAEAEGEGWRFPPFPLEMLGVVAEEDVAWVEPRLGPQPVATYDEPVQGTAGEWTRFPRTYIACAESAFKGVFAPFVETARADPGWSHVELAASHSPMVTEPVALAKALLEELPDS
jgi:pimeloyl-ACP methyl ester carboxylesterase